MIRYLTCTILLLGLSQTGVTGEQATAKEPDYPLFAVSIERSYSPTELDKIATWFTATHGSLPADQVTYLKSKRPEFQVLAHINSTYTNGPDAPYVEAKLRDAVAMYHTANLAEALDTKAKTFQLTAVGNRDIVLKASTVEGDVDISDKGTSQYVTWIRIDDEYMRIEKWKPATGRITATRGFAGTNPERHAGGTAVLSPVYIGIKGTTVWTGYYPDGPGRFLRYALRNDHKAMYDFKIAQIIKVIKADESDGPWLDIMGMGFFNQSNMDGRPVRPWNFKTGKTYTREEYRDDIQRKAQYFRSQIERATGRRVIMVANNLSGKYFPEDGFGKLYLLPTAIKPDPLDGLVLEGFAGEFLNNHLRTDKSMIGNIQIVMDMEKNRLGGYLSYDNCASRRARTPEEARQKELHERYAYACYLLGAEASGTVRFGIAAYRRPGQDNPKPHLWLHPQYFYRIGAPKQTVAYQDIEKYQLPGYATYCREFENGFVFVNLSSKDRDRLEFGQVSRLPDSLIDPDNKEIISELELGPHSGKILLKNGKFTEK